MSELSGIVRNGIERGWPPEEIKTSLVNSGYSAQEIDYELSQLLNAQSSQPVQQPIPVQKPIPSLQPVPEMPPAQQSKFNPQDLTHYQMPVQEEKKAGNGIVIAIVILLVLCVSAGAGLYLFG